MSNTTLEVETLLIEEIKEPELQRKNTSFLKAQQGKLRNKSSVMLAKKRQGKTFAHPRKISESFTRKDAIIYLSQMTEALADLAVKQRFTLVAYFLRMAHAEADLIRRQMEVSVEEPMRSVDSAL